MKYTVIITVLAFLVGSCTPNSSTSEKTENNRNKDIKISYVHQNTPEAKSLLKKGALIVKLSETALGTELNRAIKERGTKGAIDFCNKNAIKITDSLSEEYDVTIRRIAKKFRNAVNKTNAVESEIYKQYIMEWLSNETLKSKITINAENHPVFYKPIMINGKCLLCHGEAGKTIKKDVADKIAKLYPNDKAINFKLGQPRGMWAITFNGITANLQ